MVAEQRFGYEQGNAVADDLASDVMMRRDPAITRSSAVRQDSQIRRAPNSAGLYDVLDLILDKGIVIDAFVRVSLVGIELLTVDLRIVIASVDTYLRYAEGVERLGVYDRSGSKRLPDMVGTGMKTAALKKGAESVGKIFNGGGNGKHGRDDYGEEEESGITGTLKRGVRSIVGKITGSDDDDEDDDRDDRDDEREVEHHPVRREGKGGGGGGDRPTDRQKSGARR